MPSPLSGLTRLRVADIVQFSPPLRDGPAHRQQGGDALRCRAPTPRAPGRQDEQFLVFTFAAAAWWSAPHSPGSPAGWGGILRVARLPPVVGCRGRSAVAGLRGALVVAQLQVGVDHGSSAWVLRSCGLRCHGIVPRLQLHAQLPGDGGRTPSARTRIPCGSPCFAPRGWSRWLRRVRRQPGRSPSARPPKRLRLQSAEPGTGVDCVAQQGSVEIAAGDRGATAGISAPAGRGDRSAEAVQLQPLICGCPSAGPPHRLQGAHGAMRPILACLIARLGGGSAIDHQGVPPARAAWYAAAAPAGPANDQHVGAQLILRYPVGRLALVAESCVEEEEN